MGKFNIPVINLYDLDGQSNMNGSDTSISADLPAAYQGAQTGVFIYYKDTRTSADDGSWQTLTPGTNNADPDDTPGDVFGIESKFPKDLKDNLGKLVYVVKSARTGTAIAAHFNGAAEGITTNDYYLTPALSKAAKDGMIVLKSVWFQGFSDSSSEAAANAYAANLATLAANKRTYFRTKIASAVEFDIIVLESPDFTGAPSVPAYVDIIQAAQLAFAATGRKNHSIAKPSIVTFVGGGGVHIDGQTQIRYADLVYNTIKDL